MTLNLPNGAPIDKDVLEAAMEDSDLSHSYFLNTQTGEVLSFFDDDLSDEQEKQLEEIDSSNDYTKIDRISSHEAFQWMEDFAAEIVNPQDKQVAKKLFSALKGRGAFSRFKDVLRSGDDRWLQLWYQWREDHLNKAMEEWIATL